MKKLTCPDCDSDRVVTECHEEIFVNTDEHYCHSMKAHDSDSPARCLDCGWAGVRDNLKSITDLRR